MTYKEYKNANPDIILLIKEINDNWAEFWVEDEHTLVGEEKEDLIIDGDTVIFMTDCISSSGLKRLINHEKFDGISALNAQNDPLFGIIFLI